MQHWMVMRAAAQTHLYCGTAARARAELADDIERSKRSPLMRLAPLRAEHDWMLGRLALAEAEAERTDAGMRRGRLRLVLAAARRLHRLGLPQSRTTASLLRAGVAFQNGDLHRALQMLVEAETSASKYGLRVMQAAARRRRCQLLGGSAGEEQIVAVDEWAHDQGIRRPDKLVRMYAPGFDGGLSSK
jgi:hypothetical protein